MVIDDLHSFDRLVEACGNKYLAVVFISEAARRLGQQRKEYQISESKLIQWILTGTCPYTDIQLEMRKKPKDDESLNRLLCWVIDKQVADEVRCLYRKSIHEQRLIYSHNASLSQSRIDRVNILLRMIWYSTL